MKAMVVGAAGFVGDYLIDSILNNLACDVVATKLENETYTRSDVEICNLNILDAEAVQALLQRVKPTYVFHLAAQSSVALAWKNPGMTTAVNVKGSLNIINAIRTLDDMPRTLIVGSAEEYGRVKQDTPIMETTALHPGNIYAITKACQNMIARVYYQAFHTQLIMVRAFPHIGPRQAPAFVVSDFCKQIAEIELGLRDPEIHVGNLKAKRDFTDVRDIVEAYTRIVQLGLPGETYNVGRGQAVEIAYILDVIRSMSTRKVQVVIDPQKLRPVDIPIIEPDVSKVYQATGWKAKIPLEKTISDTLDYWRHVCSQEGYTI